MSDLTTIKNETGATAFIKREWHLPLRAALASLPIVGNAISVLLEDQMSRRNQRAILELIQQLAKRLETNETSLDRVSDKLFDFALTKLSTQTERWKPLVIANILAPLNGDHNQLFKELLIDHTTQLTDFDLAVFWDISDASPDLFPSETRYALLELQNSHPEIGMLRTVSEEKLVQLRFLRLHTENGARTFVVTEIGSALIEAVK